MPDSLSYLYRLALPDSLPVEPADTLLSADSVFGAASYRLPDVAFQTSEAVSEAVFKSVPFQGLVLVLTIIYMLLLYYNRIQVGELLSWMFYSSDEALYDEHSEYRYGVWWRMLGLMSVSMILLALFYWAFPTVVNHHDAWYVLVMGVLLTLGLWLFEWLVLDLVGRLVVQQGLTSRIIQLKRYGVELIGVCLSPFILGFAASSAGLEKVLFGIIVGGLAIVMSIFVVKSIKLFVASNVSIFSWILYLCAVEIFPMSFALVMLLRVL